MNAGDAPRLERASGRGRLVVGRRGSPTMLIDLYEEGCARIRLPATHAGHVEAVLLNTAGGLTGGDRLAWEMSAGPGARLVLTTPACERIYRSLGDDAVVETRLSAKIGAHIDWLPQETILFAGARLSRRLEVDLAGDATLTALEAVLLGRMAMGETARDAKFSDHWRIRRDGRLIHAEATVLADPDARDNLALLAGAGAFATLVHISPQAEARLAAVRALLPNTGGASVIGERLVVRLLAADGLRLRRALLPLIALLSGAGGLPRQWRF